MSKDMEVIGKVPDLAQYEPAGLDLCPEYWTPLSEGESRRLVFVKIETRSMPSADDPNVMVDLECALFAEPGTPPRLVANGTKRLVGVFEGGKVAPGTPVQITYLGEAQNSTNNKKSSSWSIVVLQKKGGE